MFTQQLLKLVERLIEMTEKEVSLIKEMKITEAGSITTEKEPLVALYQSCIEKIQIDENIRRTLKAWDQFDYLKKRIEFLGELSNEHEQCIKRVEKTKSRFVEMMQEKVVNIIQPVQNYNRQGYVVNRQQHYAKQGGGSLSTLDQTF